MKKLITVLLLMMMSLVMTACVPPEDLFEDPIVCLENQTLINEICVDDIIEVDIYSYDVSGLPEYITDYLGDDSYTHIGE